MDNFPRNSCKHKIQYYLKKKRSSPYWVFRNTGNFFCFNSSLSNLYNNVIIYEIKTKSWEQFCLWTNLQNFPIQVIMALYINVSLYLALTIQESSRLKGSTNHLWNSSDVSRKTFGEWSPLKRIFESYKAENMFIKECIVLYLNHTMHAFIPGAFSKWLFISIKRFQNFKYINRKSMNIHWPGTNFINNGFIWCMRRQVRIPYW